MFIETSIYYLISPTKTYFEYQNYVVNILNKKISDSFVQNLFSTAKKIVAVVSFPLIALLLLPLVTIEKMINYFKKPHSSKGDLPQNETFYKRKVNCSEFDLSLYHKIKNNWREEKEDALSRLKNENIITPQIELLIDKAMQHIDFLKKSYAEKNTNSKEVLTLINRTIEIKKIYENSHYIFTHANSSTYYASSCLIKQLMKAFFPERKIHSFHFLRPPMQTHAIDEIEVYKNLLSNASSNSSINDHIGEISINLLSVDGYLFNATLGESAINFLSRNYSVLSNRSKLGFQNIFLTSLMSFAPKIPEETWTPIVDKMVEISKKIKNACGNLFIICIPKKMIDDPSQQIIYRSHPYGKPCDCHPFDRDLDVLQRLQNYQLSKETACNDGTIPQYRLLAASMIPEKGVHTFCLTPFDKSTKKQIKKEIAEIAKEAHTLAQV